MYQNRTGSDRWEMGSPHLLLGRHPLGTKAKHSRYQGTPRLAELAAEGVEPHLALGALDTPKKPREVQIPVGSRPYVLLASQLMDGIDKRPIREFTKKPPDPSGYKVPGVDPGFQIARIGNPVHLLAALCIHRSAVTAEIALALTKHIDRGVGTHPEKQATMIAWIRDRSRRSPFHEPQNAGLDRIVRVSRIPEKVLYTPTPY